MRIWLLTILVVLCVVAGMLIPVPRLIFQEVFAPVEVTAPPMSNIGLADRAADLDATPAPEPAPGPSSTPEPLRGQVLAHDPDLQEGVLDWYAEPVSLRLDFDSLSWTEVYDDPPEPEILPKVSAVEGTVSSVLPLENGFAVTGDDSGAAFLRFYAQDGSLLHTYDASAVDAEGKLFPMSDRVCAYVPAKDGRFIVVNSLDGSQYVSQFGDRPVWLDPEDGTLLVRRGVDYILIAMASGAEASYQLKQEE